VVEVPDAVAGAAAAGVAAATAEDAANVSETWNWTGYAHPPVPPVLAAEPPVALVLLLVDEASVTAVTPLTRCSCTIVWATVACEAAHPVSAIVGTGGAVAVAPGVEVAVSEVSAAVAGIIPPI
jgi:hypothetical protein